MLRYGDVPCLEVCVCVVLCQQRLCPGQHGVEADDGAGSLHAVAVLRPFLLPAMYSTMLKSNFKKKLNPRFGSDTSFSILQLLVECAGLCLLVRQTVVLTGLHSGHRVLPRLEGVEHQLVRAGLGGQHHLQLHG